ncbi:hypothetical protein GCM10010381_31160 [Streptomyces xantholiticus]|nr:hypothetical protein GCM10010381_31160 [Streptomyces xantholiticus]
MLIDRAGGTRVDKARLDVFDEDLTRLGGDLGATRRLLARQRCAPPRTAVGSEGRDTSRSAQR